MMLVVMYWPVQSWMVSLIGSFDSTAAAVPNPAGPVAISIAAVRFLKDVFIGVSASCRRTEPVSCTNSPREACAQRTPDSMAGGGSGKTFPQRR